MMWKKWMGAFLTLALCVFLGTASSAEAAAKAAFLVSSAYSIIYARGARRAEHWKPPWATLCIIASKATI